MTLAGAGLGFQYAVRSLNVYLLKEAVDLRSHFDNIPTKLATWSAPVGSVKYPPEMIEELGTDLYLDRRYTKDDTSERVWVGLHLAYYTGMIDAVPHVPDRCMIAAGFNAQSKRHNYPVALDRSAWRPDPESEHDDYLVTVLDSVTRVPSTVRLPRGEIRIRTTEFSKKDMPNSRIFAGYFFVANGRIAVTPEDVKLLAFKKSEKRAYYCKVQFFTIGDRDFGPDQFRARSADLLNEILPELMRCLPDWTELQTDGTTPLARNL